MDREENTGPGLLGVTRPTSPGSHHKSSTEQKCRNPRLLGSWNSRCGVKPTMQGHLGELPSAEYLYLKCTTTFNLYSHPKRKVLLSLSPLYREEN